MPSNWKEKALCVESSEPDIWFSYNIEDVHRACDVCKVCPVRKECLISAWNSETFYGINGGLTEFEYLQITWKEARSERESNWSRANKLLKGILQKIS